MKAVHEEVVQILVVARTETGDQVLILDPAARQ